MTRGSAPVHRWEQSPRPPLWDRRPRSPCSSRNEPPYEIPDQPLKALVSAVKRIRGAGRHRAAGGVVGLVKSPL